MNLKVLQHINATIQETSGMGAVAYNAATMAKEENYIVSLLCTKNRSNLPASMVEELGVAFLFRDRLISYLARVIGIKRKSYNDKIKRFEQASLLNIKSCDIYHSWDRSPACFRKAKELGAVTILDVAMNIWPGKDLQYVDYVCVPSRPLYKKALGIGIPEERLFYHPFGVDIDTFKPVAKVEGRIRFMFSGTLNDRKGIKELLLAWNLADLPNADLVLCGHGKNTSYFKDLMIQLKPKNLILKGFLNWQELVHEYNQAHIFVFPSKKEGSAKCVYEAMASGLPVITTDESGSIIEDKKDGFILIQEDFKSLANLMQELYSSKKLRSSIGKKARLKAVQNSWQNYRERLGRIYEVISKNHTNI